MTKIKNTLALLAVALGSGWCTAQLPTGYVVVAPGTPVLAGQCPFMIDPQSPPLAQVEALNESAKVVWQNLEPRDFANLLPVFEAFTRAYKDNIKVDGLNKLFRGTISDFNVTLLSSLRDKLRDLEISSADAAVLSDTIKRIKAYLLGLFPKNPQWVDTGTINEILSLIDSSDKKFAEAPGYPAGVTLRPGLEWRPTSAMPDYPAVSMMLGNDGQWWAGYPKDAPWGPAPSAPEWHSSFDPAVREESVKADGDVATLKKLIRDQDTFSMSMLCQRYAIEYEDLLTIGAGILAAVTDKTQREFNKEKLTLLLYICKLKYTQRTYSGLDLRDEVIITLNALSESEKIYYDIYNKFITMLMKALQNKISALVKAPEYAIALAEWKTYWLDLVKELDGYFDRVESPFMGKIPAYYENFISRSETSPSRYKQLRRLLE